MTDWVEISALVAGPAIAVGLTVWTDKRRSERDRKLGILRQFLLLRAHAGDAGFSHAVNLIPVEFGHSQPVMTAYEAFDHTATAGHANKELVDKLAKEMMIA